jgi:tetratricopeptide (TPR) repeat protein
LGPALFFGLLESGLRLFGYGYPTSFFIEREQRAGGPIFIENLEFGRRFFPPGLVRAPLTLSMPGIKPVGSYRIFVLGESAAQGIPDPSTSFARILQVMLRDRYPERRFEIINTAMVAINSNVVLPIARECAQHHPDLFIVHLGNNEVVGPFGAAGVIGPSSTSSSLIRGILLAKTTRTGQLLDDLMQRLRFGKGTPPRFWAGMEMFLKSRVRAEDPRLAATFARFRENLGEICRVGVRAGAKVIVCTIPVNIRDCAPFASLHAPHLTSEQLNTWEGYYRDGTSLEAAGKFAEAVRRYHEAARIDDRFAELHFRLGRCYAALGRAGEAAQRFACARDLDALRFRSDSTINRTIRRVVGAWAAGGVSLVDAERDFASSSPSGIPGDDLFYEHVHMRFSGNYLIARALLREIAKILPPSPRAQDRAGLLSEQQCAERLAYTGRERYRDAAKIHEMLQRPPFAGQLDVAEREERWEGHLQELRAYLRPEALQVAISVSRDALVAAPDDWMVRMHLAQLLTESGDLGRAAEQYKAVLDQLPHCFMAHYKLGTLLLKMGRLEEARDRFHAALRIAPDYVGAHYGLAEVLVAQGKVHEAIVVYAERVDKDSDRVEALRQMAVFLDRLGRPRRAKACLEEALRLDPDDALIHVDLGNILAREGTREAAIAHYEEALRLRPYWREMGDHLAKLRKARDDGGSGREE